MWPGPREQNENVPPKSWVLESWMFWVSILSLVYGMYGFFKPLHAAILVSIFQAAGGLHHRREASTKPCIPSSVRERVPGCRGSSYHAAALTTACATASQPQGAKRRRGLLLGAVGVSSVSTKHIRRSRARAALGPAA